MTALSRLRALPLAGQVALAAVATLLIASILIAAWLLTRPRYEVLFSDLRPADAATIVAALDERSTPYRLTEGGATILVPAQTLDAVRLDIMNSDLPLKGTVGFELFNKSDMGLTEFAQRINYQRALQGELSRTIMTIDVIDTARVHLTLPEPTIFRADRRPPKASVTLASRAGQTLDSSTIAGVQRLVAAAVPDLALTDVVVLNAHGELVSGSSDVQPSPAPPKLQQLRAIEQFYAARVRQVLGSLYPGITATILIPADQWSLDGGRRQTAISTWSPDSRDFRLKVTLATSSLSEGDQAEIRAVLSAPNVLGEWPGDQILFAPPSTGSVEAASAALGSVPDQVLAEKATSPETSPVPMPDNGSSGLLWGLGGLIVLGLIGIAAWRARRRKGPDRLTPEARDAYVRRLARLLDERDAKEVSRV